MANQKVLEAWPRCSWDRAVQVMSLGSMAGFALASLDLVAIQVLGAGHDSGFSWFAWGYAAVLGAGAGLAAGLVAGLLAFLTPPRKPWPLAGAAALVLIFTLFPIFDGAWIAAQSWSETARYGVLVGSALGCFWGVPILMRFSVRRPGLAAGSVGLAAMVAASANLLFLAAYPSLRQLMVFVAWIGLCWLGAALFPARSWRTAAIQIGLCVLLLAGGFILRGQPEIHRARSAIVGDPWPLNQVLMRPVERWVFDWVAPLPSLFSETADIDFARDRDDATDEKVLLSSLRRLGSDAERAKWNVLWVAVDTLRADHVSCLGYERTTTPNIDALAASGLLFERAVSPVSSSALTYSSVMSGSYGRVSPAFVGAMLATQRVPDDYNLAAQLVSFGHTTEAVVGFSSGFQAQAAFPYIRAGFSRFDGQDSGRGYSASEVTRRGVERLDRLAEKGEPFFLWLHYMDAHAPYEQHPQFDFGPRRLDAYDSEIAYCDHEIGRVLDRLDALGLADNTVVVVFSDHGEAFGEHNLRYHGTGLYEHQVRVPLIIRIPSLTPQRLQAWVGLSDLLPTTMALLGAKDPYRRLGRSLLPLVLNPDLPRRDFAYAGVPAKEEASRSAARGIWSGDLKMVWKPSAQTIDVFDLMRDPAEKRNIFDSQDANQRRMMSFMRAWDRQIDSYWAQGPARTTHRPRAALKEPERAVNLESRGMRLHQLVADYLAAEERQPRQAETDVQLARIDALLKAPPTFFDLSRVDAESRAALEPLKETLIMKLRSPDKLSAADLPRCSLLTFFDDPSLFPALERAYRTFKTPDLRFSCWLAWQGSRLPTKNLLIVARSSESSLIDRISATAALASLGEMRADYGLVAALSSPDIEVLIAATRGCLVGGIEAPLRHLVFSHKDIWESERLTTTLVSSLHALEAGGDPPIALPLRRAAWWLLANRGDDPRALDQLESLVGSNLFGRRQQVYEKLLDLRVAHSYARWPLAVREFQQFDSEALETLGSLAWYGVESYWRGRQFERSELLLSKFVETLAASSILRQLRGKLSSTPARPRVSDLDLSLEVISWSPAKVPVLGGLYLVDLWIVNRGNQVLLGGECDSAPWLYACWFGQKRGFVEGLFETHLPWEGLAPGERRRVSIWVTAPKKTDFYRLQFILGRGKGIAGAKLLLELPRFDLK